MSRSGELTFLSPRQHTICYRLILVRLDCRSQTPLNTSSPQYVLVTKATIFDYFKQNNLSFSQTCSSRSLMCKVSASSVGSSRSPTSLSRCSKNRFVIPSDLVLVEEYLTANNPHHVSFRYPPRHLTEYKSTSITGHSTSESRHEQFPFPSLDLSSCCFNLSCR